MKIVILFENFVPITVTMKKVFYSLSALTLALMFCVSFYFSLFYLFKVSPQIGLMVVSFVIFLGVVVIRDEDFIAEIEE